jgi:hypothetical protein
MFLKLRERDLLIAVENLQDLTNPYETHVSGRLQWGDEEQDPETFNKNDLCFPSGEDLPRCWRDVHFRDREVVHD